MLQHILGVVIVVDINIHDITNACMHKLIEYNRYPALWRCPIPFRLALDIWNVMCTHAVHSYPHFRQCFAVCLVLVSAKFYCTAPQTMSRNWVKENLRVKRLYV